MCSGKYQEHIIYIIYIIYTLCMMYIIYTIIYIIYIIYIYHPGKHYFGIIVGKCRKCADRMGGFSWANAPGRRASRGYLRAPGF